MEDELIISLIEDIIQSNVYIEDMPYNWTDEVIKQLNSDSIRQSSVEILKLLKEKNLLNAAAALPDA